MQLTLSFDVCHAGKDKQNRMLRGGDRQTHRGPAATLRSRPPAIVRMCDRVAIIATAIATGA
jgi:hypothetical protein